MSGKVQVKCGLLEMRRWIPRHREPNGVAGFAVVFARVASVILGAELINLQYMWVA